MTRNKNVSDYYTSEGLGQRLLSALAETGKNLSALTVEDLAPVDAFHIRGRQATQELSRWAEILPEHRVLDVGCGLGCTSRFLAKTFGCHVTGVDLTDPFCKVAGMLSARVGLTDRTDFQVCDALEMPFPDRQFDAVWTEHVQMNIADKSTFYGEIKRVLKARGTFLFHDLFAGESGELHYPLPWAGDASINHLVSVESIERTMNDLGFERLRWEDKTGESADFFRGALEHISTNGWHPAGLHLVIGKNAEIKFTNLLRNLEEDRLRVVQAVLKRDLS